MDIVKEVIEDPCTLTEVIFQANEEELIHTMLYRSIPAEFMDDEGGYIPKYEVMLHDAVCFFVDRWDRRLKNVDMGQFLSLIEFLRVAEQRQMMLLP